MKVVRHTRRSGRGLEDAASVCFSPKLLGDNAGADALDRKRRCEDDSTAMADIESAAISFMKHLREFTYTPVLLLPCSIRPPLSPMRSK